MSHGERGFPVSGAATTPELRCPDCGAPCFMDDRQTGGAQPRAFERATSGLICARCQAPARIAMFNIRAPECGQREPEPAGERVSEEERERLACYVDLAFLRLDGLWDDYSRAALRRAASLLRTSSARPAEPDLEACAQELIEAHLAWVRAWTPEIDLRARYVAILARHLAPTSDR